jgi:hypothetical protein
VNTHTVCRHAPGIVSRTINGEAVLVNPARQKIQVLNPVGARAWDLLDGRHELGEVIAIIAGEYRQPHDAVERDILLLCEDLVRRELIAIDVSQ